MTHDKQIREFNHLTTAAIVANIRRIEALMPGLGCGAGDSDPRTILHGLAWTAAVTGMRPTIPITGEQWVLAGGTRQEQAAVKTKLVNEAGQMVDEILGHRFAMKVASEDRDLAVLISEVRNAAWMIGDKQHRG